MVGKNNLELVTVKIEVELKTIEGSQKIFRDVQAGHSVEFNNGEIKLELLSVDNALSFDGGLIVEYLLSFSLGVASSVVGNFLFLSLCDQGKKLTINGRRALITEENITRIIDEKINAALTAQAAKSHFVKGTEKLFLIVTANKNETNALLNCEDDFFTYKSNIQSTLPHDANFYNIGKLGYYSVVHLELVDQASARQSASILSISNAIDAYNPDAVILVGVAFGLDDGTSKWQTIGDVLISKTVTDYESGIIRKGEFLSDGVTSEAGKFLVNVFASLSRTWIFNLENKPAECIAGNILSGDKFVDDLKFKCELIKRYPLAIGGEMEGRGAYAACRDRGINEWIIVKGICDWGDGNTNQNKQLNQIVASRSAVSLLRHVFSNPNVFDKLPTKST